MLLFRNIRNYVLCNFWFILFRLFVILSNRLDGNLLHCQWSQQTTNYIIVIFARKSFTKMVCAGKIPAFVQFSEPVIEVKMMPTGQIQTKFSAQYRDKAKISILPQIILNECLWNYCYYLLVWHFWSGALCTYNRSLKWSALDRSKTIEEREKILNRAETKYVQWERIENRLDVFKGENQYFKCLN